MSENVIPYLQKCSLLDRNIQSAKKEGEDFRVAMKGKVIETTFLQNQIEEHKITLEKLKVLFSH
jgi:hypothetical protein